MATLTLEQVLDAQGLATVDLMKVDIEGFNTRRCWDYREYWTPPANQSHRPGLQHSRGAGSGSGDVRGAAESLRLLEGGDV